LNKKFFQTDLRFYCPSKILGTHHIFKFC